MNDQEKIIAILTNYQVRNDIEACALVRLMYSDLSHIGAALLSGETILSNNNKGPYYFKNPRSYYTIKPKTIMFNGCEINAPVEWKDYKRLQLVSVASTHTTSEVTYSTACGPHDDFKRGIVFRTEEDAQAYRKAAGWIV
tara:strand:+ start:338 stop:757 length:420 start_codon:yes stop_codon:yes gene_type:complete